MILALLACTGRFPPSESDTVKETGEAPSLPEAMSVALLDRDNLLLPFDVAVDAAGRRAWVSGLITPTVAEVDLDAAALVAIHTLPALPGFPELAVDGLGTAWLSGGSNLPLARLHGGESPRQVDIELGAVNEVVGLPGGGALVAGTRGRDTPMVLRVDAEGATLAERQPAGLVVAAVAVADGVAIVVNALEEGVWIEVVDADTLEVSATCPISTTRNAIAPLPGGRYVLTSNRTTTVTDCTDEIEVERGTENRDPVVDGDTIWILDRIGDEAPNQGIARGYTADLAPTTEFRTGKNSGYGGRDAQTGLLWMNSEGTTEVQAYDPLAGTLTHAVDVGQHLETPAVDPEVPGVAWVSARLSGEVLRIDLVTGDVRRSEEALGWPVSPVLAEGSLWVMDQLSTVLWELDPDTLVTRRRLDLGLDENVQLNFDTLAFHPGRGTFFLAAAQENALLELDLDGAVLGRWALAGEPIEDPDLTGITQVVIDGDAVLTLRTQDGIVTRIDPDLPDPVGFVELDAAHLFLVQYDTLPWAAFVDGGILWLGSAAFDAATLLARPELDLPFTRVLGRTSAGGFVGWHAEEGAVAVVDAGGEEVASAPLVASTYGDPMPVWTEGWGGYAVYLRLDRAEVHAVALW